MFWRLLGDIHLNNLIHHLCIIHPLSISPSLTSASHIPCCHSIDKSDLKSPGEAWPQNETSCYFFHLSWYECWMLLSPLQSSLLVISAADKPLCPPKSAINLSAAQILHYTQVPSINNRAAHKLSAQLPLYLTYSLFLLNISTFFCLIYNNNTRYYKPLPPHLAKNSLLTTLQSHTHRRHYCVGLIWSQISAGNLYKFDSVIWSGP